MQKGARALAPTAASLRAGLAFGLSPTFYINLPSGGRGPGDRRA
jgi:hypothetical protein